jgi:hypothetical protein
LARRENKEKTIVFEDFISKRKKTQRKESVFEKKLYEYIAPKNVIYHHIVHHEQKEKKKTM